MAYKVRYRRYKDWIVNMSDMSSLPKWAQKKIADLSRDLENTKLDLDATRQAHAVLSERKWFVIPNKIDNDGMKLWLLDKDHPFPVCSLCVGDVLLVGRAKD